MIAFDWLPLEQKPRYPPEEGINSWYPSPEPSVTYVSKSCSLLPPAEEHTQQQSRHYASPTMTIFCIFAACRRQGTFTEERASDEFGLFSVNVCPPPQSVGQPHAQHTPACRSASPVRSLPSKPSFLKRATQPLTLQMHARGAQNRSSCRGVAAQWEGPTGERQQAVVARVGSAARDESAHPRPGAGTRTCA